MGPSVYICIDSSDPEALAPFWAEALGYKVGDSLPGRNYLSLEAPDATSPAVYFQRVPEAKTIKNRLHLDLRSVEPHALIERLASLGATRIADPQTGSTCAWWQVMADPEGNEFCVCDVSGSC